MIDEKQFNETISNWDRLNEPVACDMDIKTLFSILKTWNTSLVELYDFISNYQIEARVLKKLTKNGIVNKNSILFQKEVIIHGLEEHIRQLYKQGVMPHKIKVDGDDPFLATCLKMKWNGKKISIPILPRPSLLQST